MLSTRSLIVAADGTAMVIPISGVGVTVTGVTIDGLPTTSYTFANGRVSLSVSPERGALIKVSYTEVAQENAGGITSEQLDALVSDPELATSEAAIVAAVQTRATPADISALETSLLASLSGAGATPGEVRLFNNASGAAPSGWTKASGLSVQEGLWASARMSLLPNRNVTGNPAAGGSLGNYMLQVASNAKVYALHGVQVTAAKAFSAFNLASLSWQALSAHPSTTTVGSMVSTDSALFTFAGGGSTTGSGNTTTSCHKYTIVTDSWTSIASRPVTSRNPVVLKRSDGKIVLAGGLNATTAASSTTALNRVDLYDPAANTWSTLTNCPYQIAGGNVVPLAGNKFLVMCWMYDPATTTTTTNARLIYDATADTWSIADALPAGYTGSSTVAVPASGGKAVFYASAAPSGTSRGLLYDHSQASGSRWSAIDLGDSLNFGLNIGNEGTCSEAYDGVYGFCQLSLSGASSHPLALIRTDGTNVSTGQSFYAVKN